MRLYCHSHSHGFEKLTGQRDTSYMMMKETKKESQPGKTKISNLSLSLCSKISSLEILIFFEFLCVSETSVDKILSELSLSRF